MILATPIFSPLSLHMILTSSFKLKLYSQNASLNSSIHKFSSVQSDTHTTTMPGELAEDPIDVENNNHTDQNTSTSLWKVSTLPNIGKVLLATRDIKPWEKVLEDTALVTAPCNSAACLGCLGAVSGEVVCARCKWPVCQKQCQDQQSHQEECWLFQSSQIFPKADQLESSHGIYSFISVLRILLLKTTDKTRQGGGLLRR